MSLQIILKAPHCRPSPAPHPRGLHSPGLQPGAWPADLPQPGTPGREEQGLPQRTLVLQLTAPPHTWLRQDRNRRARGQSASGRAPVCLRWKAALSNGHETGFSALKVQPTDLQGRGIMSAGTHTFFSCCTDIHKGLQAPGLYGALARCRVRGAAANTTLTPTAVAKSGLPCWSAKGRSTQGRARDMEPGHR